MTSSLRSRVPAAALPVVALFALPAVAAGGGIDVPCSAPTVFSGAAVNVVVVPYSAPDELTGSAGVGRELARLIQAELLLSIAKFGSVGSVQLTPDGAGCDPDVVIAKLMGRIPGARQTLRQGHAVVLVWGRIFWDGDAIFLQTYVRFAQRAAPDVVGVRIGPETLGVRQSGQAFACVPRRIRRTDLARIGEGFGRAAVLHERPDPASRSVPIPSGVPFSYFVAETRGDWMRVQGQGPGGPNGWLLAKPTSGDGWALRALVPELAFVEGVTGYYRFRVATLTRQPSPEATLDLAARAMQLYQERWRAGALMPRAGAGSRGAGYQPLAVAIPLQLRAMVLLHRPGLSLASMREAHGLLSRAADLVPYDADARNLEVVARLVRAYNGRDAGIDPRDALADLQTAAAADPGNTLALGNVARVARLLLGAPETQPEGFTPLTDAERAELRERVEAIAALAQP